MKEYALMLFGLCLVLSTLSLLSFKEGSVKLALGIIGIYVILSPLARIDFDFDYSLEITLPESAEGGYGEVARDAFERGICRSVAEKFSLEAELVSAEAVGFDFSLMRAEEIKITLTGRAVFADRRAIEEYINKMEIGACTVEIHVGKG